MVQAVSQTLLTELQACLRLTQDVSNHSEANQAFEQVRDRVAARDPQSGELLELLWNELLSARRSTVFWQELCDVEKQLSQRIAENHSQLRQNYLRLMQEQ